MLVSDNYSDIKCKNLKNLTSEREIFFKKRFYLFICERHRERSRDIGRGRSRLPVGSLMQDSIPGPLDHYLSQRQILYLPHL